MQNDLPKAPQDFKSTKGGDPTAEANQAPAWRRVAPGIYRRASGELFERPWVAGVRTWRRLDSRTIREAVLELAKRRADQALSARGLAANPYGARAVSTVADLLARYVEAGCPKRNARPRTGKQLAEEKRRTELLSEFFGSRAAASIELPDCEAYHAWRVKGVTRGRGDRSVDLELTTLSAAFRWAVRYSSATGIRSNPLAQDRGRFVRAETVRHARDCQPAGAEELHRLAEYLFDSEASAPLGWLLLFQSMTGRRVNELVALRTDATGPAVPGFVDSRCLWFERKRSHKGAAGFIRLHPALRQAIAAHRAWKAARFPASPWYFPGNRNQGAKHVDKSSLTHALGRACQVLKIPHRTSHGLRSYFVNVLRSQRIPDHEIALLIGQTSGGRLIVDVYGELRPDRIAWLPRKGEPAWAVFRSGPDNVVPLEVRA